MHKLAELGLSEDSINYIKSYLQNRKQRTKFKNCISDIETIKSGIPQGSILGPILFVCFTNDLQNEFEKQCKIVSYADDTILIAKAENPNLLTEKIEKVIQVAQNWYSTNSMKNNITKTAVMIMKKGNETDHQISVVENGQTVKILPEKYLEILGIYVDEELNWGKQIKHSKKKAMNAIINLSRLKNILPEKAKIQLYNTIVTPHFSYGDIIWGGCNKEQASKLQAAQNFAMRIIKKKNKRDSAKAILKEMQYLNLAEKRKVHEAVFITKSLLNKTAQNITNQYLEYLPSCDTRQAQTGRLNIPKHRTVAYESSPLYRTIKTWNDIPTNIETNDPRTLKKQYQKHLVEKQNQN